MIGVTQLLSKELTPTSSAYQSPTTLGMIGTTNQANVGAYVLSNSNRTMLATGSGNSGSYVFLGSDILANTGKYYWESVRNAQGSHPYYYNYHDIVAYASAGVLPTSGGANIVGNRIAYAGVGISGSSTGWYYRRINSTQNNTNPSTGGTGNFVTYSNSQVWSYRLDTDTRLLETFRNGSSFTNSSLTLAPAAFYQFMLQGRPGAQSTANLEQSDWVYSPDAL